MWRIAHTCLLILGLCPLVFGIDRDRRIDQLHHTAWTLKDGVPGEVHVLAQTTDGYLWLGTASGLFRFDGVQFERYVPPLGPPLPENNVYSLKAVSDGGLWVGFEGGGISFIKNGRATNYSSKDGLRETTVWGIFVDKQGRVWAALGMAGLFLLEGSRWTKMGADWDYSSRIGVGVYEDNDGGLWVSAIDKLFRLPKGASKFQMVLDNLKEAVSITEAPDGTLWMAESLRSVHPVPLPDKKLTGPQPEIRVGSKAIHFDQQGSLWITTLGDGLRRIPYPERLNGRQIAQFSDEAEIFTQKNGLSGDYIHSILEDREGNIWVGTNQGLDRFQQSAIAPVYFKPGSSQFTLVAGTGSTVWAGGLGPYLMQIHDGKVTKELPFGLACGYRDPDGVNWLATWQENSLSRLYHLVDDRLTPIHSPPIETPVNIIALTVDFSKRIWISVGKGISLRLENGQWKSLESLGGPRGAAITMFTDEVGHVWFAFDDELAVIDDENKVKTLSLKDSAAAGTILSMHGRGQRVWIGRESGVTLFDGSRFQQLHSADGLAFTGIYGIVATHGDGLWFSEDRGIIQVPESEVRLFLENPEYRVNYRVFDLRDGLRGILQRRALTTSVVEGTDGRLWFATTEGVVWVDPKRIPNNSLAPLLAINSVTANGNKHASLDSLKLPARIANLQIAYTALSLTTPERVRFRYKLEGADNDWQDVGTRRTAFYTNLDPGTYRFRVMACNNDGVWNEVGATLDFSIAPAWYQTIWVRMLYAALALFTIWMLYRLRLRQVARAMSVRFDERLAERTRIARELHDTLLQTVQGSKFVADAALKKYDDSVHVRQALERLSKWLAQATEEGRAALNSLRTSTTETSDLAANLRQATKECVLDSSMAVKFSVAGGPGEMHPIARDEIYRIGYEAIRNACEHSSASKLEITLTYAQDLTLRVSDNGTGIEEAVLTEGKQGHFGLRGMRERAERIGSKLTLVSSTSGTEMILVVPGNVIFRKPSTTRFERIKTFFGLNGAANPD